MIQCDKCNKKVDKLYEYWTDFPDDVLYEELCEECYEQKSW